MYHICMEEQENKQLKLNTQLQKYINEFNDDVKLDCVENLREKSLTSSAIWAKWLSYLFLEKENLERIIDSKQKILKKKMSSSSNDSILRLKTEDKISENDPIIQKLNNLQKITKDNIDYIERGLSILSNFGFNIKNAIETFKLTSN